MVVRNGAINSEHGAVCRRLQSVSTFFYNARLRNDEDRRSVINIKRAGKFAGNMAAAVNRFYAELVGAVTVFKRGVFLTVGI